MASQDPVNPSHAMFDLFVQAQCCKDVKHHFAELCRQLDINPKDFRTFYSKLKERLNYWKAKALWTKLDKRASHSDYQQGKACNKNKVLVTSDCLLFLSFKRMGEVFAGVLCFKRLYIYTTHMLHWLLIKLNLLPFLVFVIVF